MQRHFQRESVQVFVPMTGLPAAPLKVALAQMTSVDDLEKNTEQILNLLDQIPEGADLVCFPENALFFRIGRHRPIPTLRLDDPCFGRIQKRADEKGLRILLGSTPLQDPDFDGRLTNAMIELQPGQSPKAVYRKIHLFDVDVQGATPVRESDSFAHGREPAELTVKGWRLGLSICYDLRFAELYSRYGRSNVHLLLVPSSFLVPTGKAHWHILLRARAIENQCYLLAPAQSGPHLSQEGESRNTFGHSLAVDPWGEVMVDLGEAGPSVKVVELRPERLEWVHRQIPQSHHRRLKD